MKGRQIWFWVIAVALFGIDQWVKLYIRTHLSPGQYIPLLPGIFEITLTYNEGIAFGMLQGAGILLAPVAIAIAGGSAIYSLRHPNESAWSHVAFGLLAAGALGNLYDRVIHKRVTDMFYARFINFPVFNVADACITVASIMLVIVWWLEAKKSEQNPEAADAPSTM
jgi:signal peptidase II